MLLLFCWWDGVAASCCEEISGILHNKWFSTSIGDTSSGTLLKWCSASMEEGNSWQSFMSTRHLHVTPENHKATLHLYTCYLLYTNLYGSRLSCPVSQWSSRLPPKTYPSYLLDTAMCPLLCSAARKNESLNPIRGGCCEEAIGAAASVTSRPVLEVSPRPTVMPNRHLGFMLEQNVSISAMHWKMEWVRAMKDQ